MALCKNFGMSLGLQVLDLSQNKLDEGCSKYVASWCVLVCARLYASTDLQLYIF